MFVTHPWLLKGRPFWTTCLSRCRRRHHCLSLLDIPQRFCLTWVSTYKDSFWHKMCSVGMTPHCWRVLAWTVANDQMPSHWYFGSPAGKDICQRESWQLYFLFCPGLSLIHPSCSFPFSSPSFHFLPGSIHTPSPSFHHTSLRLKLSSFSYLCLLCSFLTPDVSLLLPHCQVPQSLTSHFTSAAFAFPPVPSLHVGVDGILALHMTVPANWAKNWRRAGGQ